MVGSTELIVVMIIALLVFGPKKMPEIGRSIGSALRELRRASNDFMSAIESPAIDEPESYSRFDEPEPSVVDEEPAVAEPQDTDDESASADEHTDEHKEGE